MAHSKIMTLVLACIVFEAVNVAWNILPAMKQTSDAAKRPYYVRMGIFNGVFLLGVATYVLLK